MKERYSGPVNTITLLIQVDNNEKQRIEKAFSALSRVHNDLVARIKIIMFALSGDKEYTVLQSQYAELKKKSETNPSVESKLNSVKRKLKSIQKKYGLYKYNIEKMVSQTGKRYSKILSSQQIQKEADRVWTGVEKVLYGNGKEIHFKRRYDFDTISGKSNNNGAKFDKNTCTFDWMGHKYKCRYPGNSSREKIQNYVNACLSYDISYCEIKRQMFSTGWRYYLIVYYRGSSPIVKEHASDGISGIDMGTSTVAAYCAKKAFLEILAPDVTRYDEEINRLTQKMEMSRRISNPGKFKPDGTYIKNSKKIRWKFSKNYWKYRNRRKALFRKRSQYITHSHNHLANLLLRHAIHFIVEKMSFQGLAKRSKETRKSSKPKLITDKHGFARMVCSYARKKRFGHSILIRAPSRFLTTLERKACRYGGDLSRVNTTKFRASQYDHTTDTYTPVKLTKRDKKIGDITVQRDLYSAFLLSNSDSGLEKADRERCSAGFAKFVKLQSQLIARMKASGISRKSCFGF